MRWVLPTENNQNLSLIQRLLLRRGVSLAEQESFLTPQQQPHILDSLQIFDAKTAAKQILEAVADKQKIFVYGDYDVDGVSATALVWDLLFRHLKANVLPFIPSRFDEGYGLSAGTLDNILSQGGKLVITVDCGVKEIELIKEYTTKGLQFVITDHHGLSENEKGKPEISKEALAVVHPKYPKHESEYFGQPDICGTTVAWVLAREIIREAQARSEFKELDLHVDPNSYLDLVALGTVCDVMPLTGINRILVSLGLQQLRENKRPGMQALLRNLSVSAADLQSHHIGFGIGPRLNAAGRMESALDALRLLTTRSNSQADIIVQKLQSLNSQRQDATTALLQEAEAQINANFTPDDKLYFISGQDWPEGVIGLVAGKLTEKYYRPVIVASELEDEVKGSARSIAAYHITEALNEQRHLLSRFGGHTQAAGFGTTKDRLPELSSALLSHANEKITMEDLEQILNIDLELDWSEIGTEFVNLIEQLQPFGFRNTKPVFAFPRLTLEGIYAVGKEKQHRKLIWRSPQGARVESIDFGAGTKWDHLTAGSVYDVAGQLDLNEWQGNQSIQIMLKDVRSTL